MTRPPIVLHIGMTKTSTTSIQHTCRNKQRELAEAGVLYPVAGRGQFAPTAHHNLAYEINEKHRTRFKDALGGWDQVLGEIQSKEFRTTIISSEAFSYFRSENVETMASRLKGFDVSVVVYFRRQDRWLHSLFNHEARFGRVSNRRNFIDAHYDSAKYDETVQRWSSHFPNVEAHCYDKAANGIVGDFFRRYVRVPLAIDEVTKNTRAGLRAIGVMSKIRELVGPDVEIPRQTAFAVSRKYRADPGELYKYDLFGPEQSLAIMEELSASNQRLFGLCPDMEEFSPVSPELLDRYIPFEDIQHYLLPGDLAYAEAEAAAISCSSASKPSASLFLPAALPKPS